MAKKPVSTVEQSTQQQHAATLAALAERTRRQGAVDACLREVAEAAAEVERLGRQENTLNDQGHGYQTRYHPLNDAEERARDKVAADLASIGAERARVEAALSDARARLDACKADCEAARVEVPAEVLQYHRDQLRTAAARVDELTATRERLTAAPGAAAPADLKAEQEDLLAAAALGQDVAERLAIVTASLQAAAEARASEANRNAATLAGLGRLIEAAQAERELLRDQERGLTSTRAAALLATAAARYEALAEQTMGALADVAVLADLHSQASPHVSAGYWLGSVNAVYLPNLRGESAPLTGRNLAPGHKYRTIAEDRAAGVRLSGV